MFIFPNELDISVYSYGEGREECSIKPPVEGQLWVRPCPAREEEASLWGLLRPSCICGAISSPHITSIITLRLTKDSTASSEVRVPVSSLSWYPSSTQSKLLHRRKQGIHRQENRPGSHISTPNCKRHRLVWVGRRGSKYDKVIK